MEYRPICAKAFGLFFYLMRRVNLNANLIAMRFSTPLCIKKKEKRLTCNVYINAFHSCCYFSPQIHVYNPNHKISFYDRFMIDLSCQPWTASSTMFNTVPKRRYINIYTLIYYTLKYLYLFNY